MTTLFAFLQHTNILNLSFGEVGVRTLLLTSSKNTLNECNVKTNFFLLDIVGWSKNQLYFTFKMKKKTDDHKMKWKVAFLNKKTFYLSNVKCHQSKHSRELNMTYISFGIVGIFFCLNFPRIVIGAYEVSETW